MGLSPALGSSVSSFCLPVKTSYRKRTRSGTVLGRGQIFPTSACFGTDTVPGSR